MYSFDNGLLQWYGLLSRIEFFHEHKAALPFHQHHDGSFAVLSNDGVHFPIAHGLSVGILGFSLNGYPIGNTNLDILGGRPILFPSTPKVFPGIILGMRRDQFVDGNCTHKAVCYGYRTSGPYVAWPSARLYEGHTLLWHLNYVASNARQHLVDPQKGEMAFFI